MVDVEAVSNMDFGAVAGQAASAGYDVAMWMVALVVIGAVIFGVWYILQFKHRVNLRVMTRHGYYIVQDKARETKVDGVTYWQLFKKREMATVPPPEATNQTQRGKLVADAYWHEETGIVWATDKVTREDFVKMITEVTVKDGSMQKQVQDAFQPFTTQERALQSARVTRALMRKKKSLLEAVMQLATPLALVMLVIMVLIFWEDIAKPAKEMGALNVEVSKQNAIISEQNARLLSILAQNGVLKGDVPVNQVVPAAGAGG